MASQIAAHVSKIDARILNDQYSMVGQQFAFSDILVSSMRAGLTYVATFTLDDLGSQYDGVLGHTFDLHGIGHNKDVKGMPAMDVFLKVDQEGPIRHFMG